MDAFLAIVRRKRAVADELEATARDRTEDDDAASAASSAVKKARRHTQATLSHLVRRSPMASVFGTPPGGSPPAPGSAPPLPLAPLVSPPVPPSKKIPPRPPRAPENDRFRIRDPLAWPHLGEHPWLGRLLDALGSRRVEVYCMPPGRCVYAHVPRWVDDASYVGELRPALAALPLAEGRIWEQPTPREVAYLGSIDAMRGASREGSGYAGTRAVHAMPPAIGALQGQLNALLGTHLASCIVNRYRRERVLDARGAWVRGAGKDSIAPHRDKAWLFSAGPPMIVSVSLGQARSFDLRTFVDPAAPPDERHWMRFQLGGGALFVMGGDANLHATHAVPKEEERPLTDDRWSLTFRESDAALAH